MGGGKEGEKESIQDKVEVVIFNSGKKEDRGQTGGWSPLIRNCRGPV